MMGEWHEAEGGCMIGSSCLAHVHGERHSNGQMHAVGKSLDAACSLVMVNGVPAAER